MKKLIEFTCFFNIYFPSNYGCIFNLIIKFLSMDFFPLVLINKNFMKHNLILYDIIFVE
jgi:hypothetical protein